MSRLRFVFLAVQVCVIAQAQSTGSLDVTVLDPAGAVVPRAEISLVFRSTGDRRLEVANSEGRSTLESLREGEYLIGARAAGFAASAQQSIAVRAGQNAKVELRLDLARVNSQIQVTASGRAQTADEQSKALTIVSGSEIEARREFAAAEALRQVPGVRVQQLGGPGSFVKVVIRGLRPTDTSVLLDGYRFRDAASPQGEASAFLGDILLSGVDRLEVLRGSGSSLYGTHSTAGAINVISDQGGGPLHADITAEGGGLSMAQGSARLSGSALDDRIRFSSSLQHLNVSSGVDGNDRARNLVGRGFIHTQLGGRTALQARIIGSDSFAQLNDSPQVISGLPFEPVFQAKPGINYRPAPDDPDARRSASHFSGLLSLSHTFSPNVLARVGYQHLTTRRDNRDGPAGTVFEPLFNDSNRFDGGIDTLDGRIDISARQHSLTAGYEFERETFDNLSTDENPVVSQRVNALVQAAQQSHSLFVSSQSKLAGDRLLISLSGRMQDFQLEQPSFRGSDAPYQGLQLPEPPRAWTGDVSLAYFVPSTGTKLRAHAGNSYRSPALFERLGASFFFGSFSAFGDPRLAPERLVSFDGGIDQYLASSRVRLSGTYFYTRLQETIAFDFSGLINPATDPYGRFGGYRNTGGGLARGFELSVESNPLRYTTVRAAYTYTNADEQRSVFQSGTLRSVRVSNHAWSGTIMQTVARRFDVAFDFFGATDYLYGFGNRAYSFSGPFKADLALTYRLRTTERGSIEAYTRIENLTDREYFEEGFRTPGAYGVIGLRVRF